MKTMAPLWSLAMVALLAAQTGVGFGMFDVLRASRQIKDSQREVEAAADIIVGVVLEAADVNQDQQIAFAEIGTYFDDMYYGKIENPRLEEERGYFTALATIMDADQSGTVELDELQRAATEFVNNTGTDQVGEFIRAEANMAFNGGRIIPVVKAGEIAGDFLVALDTNNDGLVSTEERDKLLESDRFNWGRRSIEGLLVNADDNDDGNLDQSEIGEFLRTMARQQKSFFRKCYVYTRIWKLAGAELANNWIGVNHPDEVMLRDIAIRQSHRWTD